MFADGRTTGVVFLARRVVASTLTAMATDRRIVWLLAGCMLAGIVADTGFAQAGDPQASYRHTVDAQGIVHVTSVAVQAKPQATDALQGSGTKADDGPSPTAIIEDVADRGRYDPWIRDAAQRYQLPESFIRAVIHTESRYNPRAVSRAGAVGLMQLMPATARFLGVTDSTDPRQNIYGGSKYLRLLANMFNGDMVLVAAGYFAGAGAVRKYGGVPPYPGVRRYVKAVLRRYYAYEREAQRLYLPPNELPREIAEQP